MKADAAGRKHDVHRHVAQLFGNDEPSLIRGAGSFLKAGIDLGGFAVAITTPSRQAAFLAHFESDGYDVRLLLAQQRLILLDAQETLADFFDGRRIDAAAFERTLGARLRQLAARSEGRRIHAYGDMVDALWLRGRTAQAAELEDCGNRLLASVGADLYCAYPVTPDAVGATSDLRRIVSAHTHAFGNVGLAL